MKFLADINIPQSVIASLINLDYDVLDLKKVNLKAKDVDIIKMAKSKKRIILTRDKDFLALTQFPKYQVPVIVIRLKNQQPAVIGSYLFRLLKNQKEEILNKSITIITEESAISNPY